MIRIHGTWKLNTEKSKFDPGPGPKMQTMTITIENGTETFKAEGTDGRGTRFRRLSRQRLDGTDGPSKGNPYADTISIKQVMPSHLVATFEEGWEGDGDGACDGVRGWKDADANDSGKSRMVRTCMTCWCLISRCRVTE